MRLVTFIVRGQARLGVLDGDEVIELPRHAHAAFTDMTALLEAGPDGIRRAAKVAELAEIRHGLADVALTAPIPRPRKFLALGLNYRQHAKEAEEQGIPIPKHQVWFNKQVSCVAGPFDDVHLPNVSDKLDYEGELAIVIGTTCRHVAADGAMNVVAGAMVANDVSVRDWQMRSPTWTLGKSFDTHGPLGPALVTLDDIDDLHDLDLRTWVNGELRQSANTSDMIYRVSQMIEHLSTAFTLEAGDVLLTGTPSGIGAAMSPRQYLREGDRVRVEIDGIGAIENRVVREPTAA